MRLWLASVAVVGVVAGCSAPSSGDGGVDGEAATSDGARRDVVGITDGGATDGSMEMDVPVGADVPTGADAPTAMDAPTATDVPVTGRDVPAMGRDVPTEGDSGGSGTNPATGCGVTIQITHPTMGEAVESCSRTGVARYYDFVATVTGGTPTQLVFHWVDPTGTPVAPDFSSAAPAPTNVTVAGGTYTAHRQVGGVYNPTLPEPLDIVGTHSSSIGTWHVGATAQVGACSVTADLTWALQHAMDRTCTYP